MSRIKHTKALLGHYKTALLEINFAYTSSSIRIQMVQELTNLMLQLSAKTVKKRQNPIRAKENK